MFCILPFLLRICHVTTVVIVMPIYPKKKIIPHKWILMGMMMMILLMISRVKRGTSRKKRKIRNNGNTNVGLTIPKTLLHTLNSMAN